MYAFAQTSLGNFDCKRELVVCSSQGEDEWVQRRGKCYLWLLSNISWLFWYQIKEVQSMLYIIHLSSNQTIRIICLHWRTFSHIKRILTGNTKTFHHWQASLNTRFCSKYYLAFCGGCRKAIQKSDRSFLILIRLQILKQSCDN